MVLRNAIDGRPIDDRPVPQDELDRRRQAVKDADAAIRAAIKREDETYEREQAARRAADEAAQRKAAEAEVAAMRATIERDLRLNGAPAGRCLNLPGFCYLRTRLRIMVAIHEDTRLFETAFPRARGRRSLASVLPVNGPDRPAHCLHYG